MSEPKHTKGPWKVNSDHPNYIFISGINGGIAEINKHLHDNPEANARLIAAAPELLEVCRKAAGLRSMAFELTRLDPFGPEANRIHAHMNNITAELQAVLAKAEGK